MSATYVIATISDMLKVPVDRRKAMLKDLETALELHEFAFGEAAGDHPIGPMEWTDDGDRSVSLHNNGQEMLKLEITEGASRRTYRASVLEAAAGVCEQMDTASMEEAKSRFLTDAGRSAYTSAAVGAANCAAAIRALAAKTQED